jgi:hypothetical protein
LDTRLFEMIQGDLSGASRASYEEDIGIDGDPEELKALEESDLCKPKVATRATSTKKLSSTVAKQGSPDSGHASSRVAPAAGTKRKRA